VSFANPADALPSFATLDARPSSLTGRNNKDLLEKAKPDSLLEVPLIIH
jgi:hypothetical protein